MRALLRAVCLGGDGARSHHRRAGSGFSLRSPRTHRALSTNLSALPPGAVRSGAGRALGRGRLMAQVPADELAIIRRFGPHRSANVLAASADPEKLVKTH